MYNKHKNLCLQQTKEIVKGNSIMDKEKIMSQLQQEMSKRYHNVEVLEYLGCLALKVGDKIIAHFRDWEPDYYFMECGPELTEWALSNSILLEFYKEGRKLLKKPIKKYTIRVLKNEAAPDDGYLNVDYQANGLTVANKNEFNGWRTSFTKKEIEELKKRDNLAIDWDKVRLEEVDE